MSNNINVRLEDISKAIEAIKDSSNEKEKEDKIKEFEGNLKQDAIMLNEYPNIKFEFVDMVDKIINSVYRGNINHKDKKQLNAIVDKIFPDEDMRGRKKTKKTKKTKTMKTKKRTKRGGADKEEQKRMNNSLITAVSSGDTILVKKLLKDGADANAKDNDSEHRNTVLMEATNCNTDIDLPWYQVERKITEIVKMLLSSGADVNAKNDNGETALQIASETDCPEEIQQLLKRHLERQRDRKNLEMVIRDKPVKRNIGRQRMPKDMENKIRTFLGGKTKTKTKTKRKTKTGGTRTRRDPKPSEKGNAYKASQILKKNTINKRNTNRQRMDELDNLFQGITFAPVSPP
jgi:hypothetical protein